MSTASFGLIFLLLFPIHYYWSGCWMSSLSLLTLISDSAHKTCQSNVSDHDWLPSTYTDRREGAMSSLRLTDFIPYSPNRLYFLCVNISQYWYIVHISQLQWRLLIYVINSNISIKSLGQIKTEQINQHFNTYAGELCLFTKYFD